MKTSNQPDAYRLPARQRGAVNASAGALDGLLHALHHPRAGYHLLRWTVAGLMLFHGLSKLIGGGTGWISGMLASHGLPAWIAYGVYLGEAVAPILVLAGIFVAPAALVMAVNMVVALSLVHGKQLFSLDPNTGGYALELQAFFLFGSIAIALMAPLRRR